MIQILLTFINNLGIIFKKVEALTTCELCPTSQTLQPNIFSEKYETANGKIVRRHVHIPS